jgi:hypothetical protein
MIIVIIVVIVSRNRYQLLTDLNCTLRYLVCAGSIIVLIYVLLMMMYVFSIPPDNAQCINDVATNTSTPTITTAIPPRDL